MLIDDIQDESEASTLESENKGSYTVTVNGKKVTEQQIMNP